MVRAYITYIPSCSFLKDRIAVSVFVDWYSPNNIISDDETWDEQACLVFFGYFIMGWQLDKTSSRFRRDVLEGTLEEMLEPEIDEKNEEEEVIAERCIYFLLREGCQKINCKQSLFFCQTPRMASALQLISHNISSHIPPIMYHIVQRHLVVCFWNPQLISTKNKIWTQMLVFAEVWVSQVNAIINPG